MNLILSPVSGVQLHRWILSRTGRVNDLGNQREFRQLIPRKGLAVVIPIRIGNRAAVESTLGEPCERHRFYIDLSPAGEPIHIPNLDGPDVTLPSQPFDCVTIQSGGKMWCGYEEFVERVRELAPFLSNSLFYVGDEEDDIDEFQIIDGVLKYSRVH